MWAGAGVDTAQPHLRGTSDLGHRGVDIPPWRDRHREQPIARHLLHLRGRVVEDLHCGEPQIGIGDLDELLPAEPERVRVHNLRPDAQLVHQRDAWCDVPRTSVDVIEPVTHETHTEHLGAIAIDRRRATRHAENNTVEHPRIATVDRLDARHAVDVLGRCPRGPQIAGLGQMRVGVDDQHVARKTQLFVEAVHHRFDPFAPFVARSRNEPWLRRPPDETGEMLKPA